MREEDLLHHIYARTRDSGPDVLIGPGDDMALVEIDGGRVLVGVDQVVDGIHVDLSSVPLPLVGRKAVTRSLSDVAAMAGRPTSALAAACLPRAMGREQAQELFDAMRETAERYGCPLVGGDITIWDRPLVISVTTLADPGGVEPVRRNSARPGDVICVTGSLGGAWFTEERGGGEPHHLHFEPRIDLARHLASRRGAPLHAMIDLSDGLATDLRRLCAASGVAAEVDPSRLPLRSAAIAAAAQDGRDPVDHALADGEDYELCFTLDAEVAKASLPTEVDGVAITQIGRILEANEAAAESPIWLVGADGQRQACEAVGWEHH